MRNLIRTVSDAAREFFGLSGSKVLFSAPKDTAQFTPEDWYNEFARKNEAAIEAGEDARSSALCPYPECEGHMLSGPTGGMSENIKCDTCDRAWNLTSIISRMEPI